MKLIFAVIFTTVSLAAFAGSEDYLKATSDFDVVAINSPVKGSVARFILKVPAAFNIDEVKVKIRNDAKIFEKVPEHKKIEAIETSNGKEIQINVSKLPPGFYQLFVKIIDKAKKEYEYKNKYKDFVMFTVDESLQVPMPDPKINNKNIAGVDTDNDGIRDDVQRWINEEYGDRPKIKMAMRQIAMGMQLQLLNSANKNLSVPATVKNLKNLGCMYQILGLDEGRVLREKLKTYLLNTKDRIYADIAINKNFSGQLYNLPTEAEDLAACAFSADSL